MKKFAILRTRNLLSAIALVGIIGFINETQAQEETNLERKGFFKRIFSNPTDGQFNRTAPWDHKTVRDEYMDRETDTISALVKDATDELQNGGDPVQRENDPVERFPHIPGYLTIKNTPQKKIDDLIEQIYVAYEARINRMDPPDLRSARVMAMGHVPAGFPAAWKSRANSPVWPDQRTVNHGIDDIYAKTLQYSNQVKVLRDTPLIRETGIQEADGEFDMEAFLEGRIARGNEASGSSLTTATNSRLIEDRDTLEGGLRKKFVTGADVTLTNRIGTLNNNAGFLRPNNQGSSELVLSVVQPLLDGGGYHYNQSRIKLAKYDASVASAEFVTQLQDHLVEVNRAYWALYYSRSYYILTSQLVRDTEQILGRLEQRSDLDALQSEVLRARSSAAMRKAMLSRAEMAIRNSEERLRALVNDPNQDIGSNAELVPVTRPIMTRYVDGVQRVASDALRNRPEIKQGFDELRAAVVRRDMQKNEKLPTLNLVAELMLSDIEGGDGVGSAFSDQFGDGTGYNLGFQFSQSIDNDTERAQLLRSELELRQQANRLRSTIDLVLLESIVSYRELMTAYRDMQGRHSALQATREELRQLRERLEVDTDEEEGGRTTASQLQLILDSMDRNQTAEELFLDSVVSYNASFASLERARGTFLRSQNVEIKRVRDEDSTHPGQQLERLDVTKGGRGAKGGKTSNYSASAPAAARYSEPEEIPDVPVATFDLPSYNEATFANENGTERKKLIKLNTSNRSKKASNAGLSRETPVSGLFSRGARAKREQSVNLVPSASARPVGGQ